MVIHCTRALAERLKQISSVTEPETSPLGSWNAQLYIIHRRTCVMFCHEKTRYTLLLPGLIKSSFEELALLFRAVFFQSLSKEGCSDAALKKVAVAMGPVRFDGRTDRSVLGTLKLTREDVGEYLRDYANVLDVDLYELAQWMNARLLNAKGRPLQPAVEMLKLVDEL